MEIDPTRQKLVRFIKAAQQGKYYNPMETVGREAAIETTWLILGTESLLGALANEVRELRGVVSSRQGIREGRWKRQHKIKSAIGKSDRSALWAIAQEIGMNAALWGRFLATAIPADMQDEMHGWSIEEWTNFLKVKAADLMAREPRASTSEFVHDVPTTPSVPESVLTKVAERLPKQPWPTGIHKQVAEELDLTSGEVSAAIQELIRRGQFHHQVDGVVLVPASDPQNGQAVRKTD